MAVRPYAHAVPRVFLLVRRIATVLGLLTDSLLVLVDTGPRDFPDLAGKQGTPVSRFGRDRESSRFGWPGISWSVCRRPGTVKVFFGLLLPSHSEQYHPLSV